MLDVISCNMYYCLMHQKKKERKQCCQFNHDVPIIVR